MRIMIWTIVILVASMLLLCVGVILRKDHSFRSQHIHENKRMKQDHIHCATAQDREMRRDNNKKMDIKKL